MLPDRGTAGNKFKSHRSGDRRGEEEGAQIFTLEYEYPLR